MLFKIYLFDNLYAIEYNINSSYLNINKAYYKPFVSIGIILFIIHASFCVFMYMVLINKYPINYILNIRKKIIKEMIYKLEDKINTI